MKRCPRCNTNAWKKQSGIGPATTYNCPCGMKFFSYLDAYQVSLSHNHMEVKVYWFLKDLAYAYANANTSKLYINTSITPGVDKWIASELLKLLPFTISKADIEKYLVLL